MHGNVWEWCEDFYDASYYGHSAKVDPVCLNEDPKLKDPAPQFRVIRGGAYQAEGKYCRAAQRRQETQGTFFFHIGFRVCCVWSEFED
jgi:formylglycine-generating enzyme required for sulfatase activity